VSSNEKTVEIKKAAVIGMGAMGTGIAQAIITAGLPVIVRDENESALRKGTDRIAGSIQKRVEQGKLSPERAKATLGLLSTTTDWPEIAGADLIIEAVFEDPQVKRSVIAELEKVCGGHTIIASNTSTISLDVLAEGMKRPGRFIGMHFFNPAHRMPLVEVIWREATQKGIIAAAMRFAKTIRKTPVLVKNREGFLVNRIFIPYLKEAFWLLEDGADPGVMDSAMVEFGFPMGPLTLSDMAGLDILAHVDRVMSRVFPTHGSLSAVAVRLVEQGHLGQKSGAGVYKYEKGDYTPHCHDVAERILAQVRRETGRALREVGKDEITDRLVLRMVNEAFYCLEEGIAQRESDIDAAMVLGTGFPDFRGGVLKYARDLGLENVLARLVKLERKLGARFAPSRILHEMKGVR
jgi:3-hydroxyacyl-CoA dehydrogenase